MRMITIFFAAAFGAVAMFFLIFFLTSTYGQPRVVSLGDPCRVPLEGAIHCIVPPNTKD